MSTSFANRLKIIREEKKISREELATKVGTSAPIIGRYEREERTPSIDTAKKIAEALQVSLDYLVGDSNTIIKDKKMMYRLELLQKISKAERDTILHVVDSLLQTAQMATTQQKLRL